MPKTKTAKLKSAAGSFGSGVLNVLVAMSEAQSAIREEERKDAVLKAAIADKYGPDAEIVVFKKENL